ncbi:MAG: pyruvate ferredoxin oxidoreductase, partial [Thermoplasmata archaeon]
WINWEKEHNDFRVTVTVPRRKHVRNYLKMQGRFSHLTDQEMDEIQQSVNEKVDTINRIVGKTVIGPLVE